MIHIKYHGHKGLESMKNHISCTSNMKNTWIIVEVLWRIECGWNHLWDVSWIFKGLGREKVRSFAKSMVRVRASTILISCLSRFKLKQATQLLTIFGIVFVNCKQVIVGCHKKVPNIINFSFLSFLPKPRALWYCQ